MGLRGSLTAFLIALALMGCKSSTPSPNGADGAGVASSAVSAGGTQTENVPDTTMNGQTAFTVKIPAKWSFQGVLLQGGLPTCESYFLLSWRAKSPDGLSSAEQMPQMLWAYGTGPHPTKGCMPITGPISGLDFLKYLAASMQLDYAADQPMPDQNAGAQKQWQDADAKAAPMYAQRNLPAPKDTGEVAGAALLG